MPNSKVLILLLTYNNAETIEKSLQDLINQSNIDFDLLIFDDFSTDKTFGICEQYSKKYNNIYIKKNQKNLGVIGNFRGALNFVKNIISAYEFFLWACPDDEWDKNYLEKCTLMLKENKDYVACQSYVNVFYQESQRNFVQKYNTLDSKSSFKEVGRIFDHLDENGNLLCYNQCIHSLIRVEFVYNLFPLKGDKFIEHLICELSIVGLMVAYGGLAIYPQALTIKNIYDQFENLNPQDPFTLLRKNKINYVISAFNIFSIMFDKDMKNNFLFLYIWWKNIIFYLVRPPYIKMKIFIYENFIRRIKNNV